MEATERITLRVTDGPRPNKHGEEWQSENPGKNPEFWTVLVRLNGKDLSEALGGTHTVEELTRMRQEKVLTLKMRIFPEKLETFQLLWEIANDEGHDLLIKADAIEVSPLREELYEGKLTYHARVWCLGAMEPITKSKSGLIINEELARKIKLKRDARAKAKEAEAGGHA